MHASLRAELTAAFGDRPLPPELASQLELIAVCPFCGCPVIGAADHGEGTVRIPDVPG
jgi:hypothetical protein